MFATLPVLVQLWVCDGIWLVVKVHVSEPKFLLMFDPALKAPLIAVQVPPNLDAGLVVELALIYVEPTG